MRKIFWEKTALGIELGSTRIKATIIDDNFNVIAEGQSEWENRYENKYWTYSLEDIHNKLQEAYKNLKQDVLNKYQQTLYKVGSIGISAMMHGYMAFDENWNLLVPFRTWRNNNTLEAAEELTKLFNFNVPARWSISHLYQAILNKEPHIKKIKRFTTLAGYIHYMLCGENVLGVGDASGMFPIDPETKSYNKVMMAKFNKLLKENDVPYQIEELLPDILLAGKIAGHTTTKGAFFLDPDGDLSSCVPLCPPEGDAGTGMVCTNSISPLTGNISAGTSIFGMIVLKDKMSRYYPEVDVVTTPVGDEVAMVHCNNCTSEINAWVNLFIQYSELMGQKVNKGDVYNKLFRESLNGQPDCGDLMTFNYTSGENITSINNGRPLFVRTPEANFNIANFVKSQIYSAFATYKYGMDKLLKEEHIQAKNFYASGGIFKTEGVAELYLASAVNTPITLMKTANEGGSYGMALLAMYAIDNELSLNDYLNQKVFKDVESRTTNPDLSLVEGFNKFEEKYIAALKIEKEADNWGN